MSGVGVRCWCHVSGVGCEVFSVMCQVSHQKKKKIKFKVWELDGEELLINMPTPSILFIVVYFPHLLNRQAIFGYFITNLWL